MTIRIEARGPDQPAPRLPSLSKRPGTHQPIPRSEPVPNHDTAAQTLTEPGRGLRGSAGGSTSLSPSASTAWRSSGPTGWASPPRWGLNGTESPHCPIAENASPQVNALTAILAPIRSREPHREPAPKPGYPQASRSQSRARERHGGQLQGSPAPGNQPSGSPGARLGPLGISRPALDDQQMGRKDR